MRVWWIYITFADMENMTNSAVCKPISYTINVRGRLVDLGQPMVIGIMNVTPDSFFADSRVQSEEAIRNRANQIIAEAKKEKIEPKDSDELKKTLDYMRYQLKSLVARDLWDMTEYFQIWNEQSDIVKKALEVIDADKK